MIHCRVDVEDCSDFAIDEGISLAKTYGAEVEHTFTFTIRKISALSYINKGQVTKVKEYLEENKVDFVFWNRLLNHRNHRALEGLLGVPVYDRAFIILEIFKQRATSSEEKLQVKLAEKEYEKAKLVRAWTHLERQRGGTSKVAGPGEKQIQIDAQILQKQITKLKQEIKDFGVSRDQQRKQRGKMPIVSLVGYTNVGKTTLFNILTSSNDLAEDKLFATLEPHVKRMKSEHNILISDTVGFIRNFPQNLSSAFIHTLEEIKYAKLILHVRDCRMPNEERYSKIITDTLTKLKANNIPRWNVWSKYDLENNVQPTLSDAQIDGRANLFVSSHTGFGIEELKKAIIEYFKPGNDDKD